jgi:hypothetical protein
MLFSCLINICSVAVGLMTWIQRYFYICVSSQEIKIVSHIFIEIWCIDFCFIISSSVLIRGDY